MVLIEYDKIESSPARLPAPTNLQTADFAQVTATAALDATGLVLCILSGVLHIY